MKHKTKVEVIPILGQYVVIVDKEDEVVFIKSVIPVGLLPNPISFYEYDVRAAADWGQYFRRLVSQDAEIDFQSEDTIKVMIDSSHAKLLRPPFKRPKPNAEEEQDPEIVEQDRNFQLARLANIIGSHPSGMGPDTILSQLATLARRFEDTSSTLSEKSKRILRYWDLYSLGTAPT